MRRWIAGIVLTGIVSCFAACTPDKDDPDRDLLRVGLEADPQNLDPRYAVDAYSDRIIKLLYRGLFRVDRDGSVQRDLATHYNYFGQQSGPTFFDVQITDTASFHNGQRLTVDDVVYSYQSVLASSTSPRNAGLTTVKAVEAVTADTGARVVRFTLTDKFSPLMTALTMGIVPAGSGRELAQIPVGAGPFRMASNRDKIITLERTPDALPNRYNRVEFRVIKNDSARSIALENGEIDLMQNALPPQDIARIDQIETMSVNRFPGANVSYLGYNMGDKLLRKAKVRQALSYAIDRPTMIRTFLASTAVPTGTVLPRANWAHNPSITTDAYDLAKADQLLTEAGYPRKGDKTRFTIEYKTSTNKLRVRMAEAIAAEWKKIGVETKILSLDFGTFFEHIRKGNFQVYTLTWTGLTEPDILYNAFHSQSIPPNGANRNRLKDATVDQLVNDARYAEDGNQRRKLYHQAQERLAEIRPYAVLWEHEMVIARQNSVPLVAPYPDGSFFFIDGLQLSQ